MLGSFNNWNINPQQVSLLKIFIKKLDGISKNMALLVQYYKYVSINKNYSTTMGYYVIKFVSEAYTPHKNTNHDGKINTAGELVIKAQYLRSIQEKTKIYWYQKQQQ